MSDAGVRPVAAATLRSSESTTDSAIAWKVRCLNCGAALAGPFCAECGQRAMPPHPTLRELAGDALAEFSGWDGKFAETIRLLVRKPGELTRQWLAGRRVAHISPLRLYIAASVVYFLVGAAAPRLRPTTATVSVGGSAPILVDERPRLTPREIGERAGRALTSGTPLTPAARDSLQQKIAKAPWFFQPLFRRSFNDPAGLRQSIVQAMPRMLFALLPVFAGIVMLFYWRRHYPEHLYFAIHLHAFAFLALMLVRVSAFSRSVPLEIAVQVAVGIWMVVYYVIAVRRVYGGSVAITVAKGVGVGILYAFAALPALTLLVLIAAW